MSNQRLRGAIAAAGLRYDEVAGRVGVDPKTVERWIARPDRKPHQRHRLALAALVGKDEAFLWPELTESRTGRDASDAELIKLYPTRGSVPWSIWLSLFADAKEQIDILAYAGLFLLDNHPELAHLLAARARQGARVRVLLGDPECAAVQLRGAEEGIGEGMAQRCRLALGYLSPAIGVAGVELRQHTTTLYNSIYRGDANMLVNQHIFGTGAPANPVLHLQKVAGGRLFSTYAGSFERIWEAAVPVPQQSDISARMGGTR